MAAFSAALQILQRRELSSEIPLFLVSEESLCYPTGGKGCTETILGEGGRATLVLAMRFELCQHQEARSGGGQGLSWARPGRQVLKWAGELAEPLEGKDRPLNTAARIKSDLGPALQVMGSIQPARPSCRSGP